MRRVNFAAKVWCLGMFMLLALAGCGCGSRDADESAGEKAVEQMVEQGLREEGKEADVQINQDDKSFSMTVTDENDKRSTMTMKVEGEASNVSITGPEGKMEMQSGAGAKIPPSFPEDVPIYPEMKVQMVMENEGPTFSVSGTSGDSLEDVVAFYKKTCVDKGWTQAMDMSQEQGTSMLHFQKGNRMLMVLTTSDGGELTINLNTGIE